MQVLYKQKCVFAGGRGTLVSVRNGLLGGGVDLLDEGVEVAQKIDM